MHYQVLVTCCLLTYGIAWTKSIKLSKIDVSKFAEAYARRHPNIETNVQIDCEDSTNGVNSPPKKDENPAIGLRNAVANPNLLWPGGIVYYQFKNATYTDQQISNILAAMTDIENKTKVNGSYCVRFLPRTTQTDFLFIEKYSGCSSYVGRMGGSQRVDLINNCIWQRGTIVHELLHALGFHHEQKRSDRDSWVIINWDNIRAGAVGNFQKLDPSQVNLLGTSYDYGSILHYNAYNFAKNASIPTIIPLNPKATIGQRVAMSPIDIQRVRILYKCL